MDCHAREKENSVCPVQYLVYTKVLAGQTRKWNKRKGQVECGMEMK